MTPSLRVNIQTELDLIDNLGNTLLKDGYNASNCFIITVSTDYSSIVGQILRHKLSYEREICEGFGVDVPYPDESWNSHYINQLKEIINLHRGYFNKIPILVEAAVIRGSNYKFICDFIKQHIPEARDTITLSLFENKDSIFKSNYVGKYYSHNQEEVEFWWEQDNKHWDQNKQ